MRRTSTIGFAVLAMAVYQSADVYASFGVNSAVMSSSDPVEHEQNMLAMNVATRDGDESIELVEPTEEDQNEEGGEENQEQEQEDPESNSEEEGGDEQEGDLEPLGEPDEELTKTSADIEQYATGFTELREQALKAGLPAEVAARIETEYDAEGKLSDDSYEQLAKAGYSKGFVNSFIQGQESLAKEYVSAIVRYAGGQEKFDRVVEHLRVNQPGSVDVLNDAIERQDLVAIRTVLNLGMASQTKKFGKQPERTLNRTGAPAGRVAAESSVKGFESQSEMVKAMSDRRYGQDKAYTAEVERKVIHASW